MTDEPTSPVASGDASGSSQPRAGGATRVPPAASLPPRKPPPQAPGGLHPLSQCALGSSLGLLRGHPTALECPQHHCVGWTG